VVQSAQHTQLWLQPWCWVECTDSGNGCFTLDGFSTFTQSAVESVSAQCFAGNGSPVMIICGT
jgi:hypothetical protein